MNDSRAWIFCALLLSVALAACGPDYGKLANIDAPPGPIVCFGDSITRGHGAAPEDSYPEQLARLLNTEVINAGRDGDTTRSALDRLDASVLVHRPWIVVVELSGNDFLQRIPVQESVDNLDAIVGRCVAAGAVVVLLHAKFGIFSDPYLDGFRNVAGKYGAALVENVLSGILGRPKYMSDQIHPNTAGYRLIAERAGEVLAEIMKVGEAAR